MRKLLVMLALTLSMPAVMAEAATKDNPAQLASQYASWAGGKANADSLVNGLRNGESITLVTVSPENKRSMAGFTAQTRMSPAEVSSALAEAKRTLTAFGIRQPSADQIQVALVGGELALPNGQKKLVAGSVTLRMEPETATSTYTVPVAAR